MTETSSGRILVSDLAAAIAHAQADAHPEKWEKPDSDESLRREIVSAINQNSLPPNGIPGILPHILKMAEKGTVCLRSTFNDMPPVDASDVTAKPSNWYVTKQDADKVKALLLVAAPAKNDIQAGAGVSAAHKRGDKWTGDELQALSQASKSGMTQGALAKEYGYTRQRISALLKQAKSEVDSKPSSTDLTKNSFATLVRFNKNK